MTRFHFFLVILALAAHGVGLRSTFVYDDHRFVVSNDALDTLTVEEAFLRPGTQTIDADRDVYRPLRALSHAFDVSRWGREPFGFHLHSILLHLLTVLLAFEVLTRLRLPGGHVPPLAGAMALAIHPLGVEVVGWISSRGDQYALFFGLAALGLAIPSPANPRPTHWRSIAAGILVLLACLGKESALATPLIFAAHSRFLGLKNRKMLIALIAGAILSLGLRQWALHGASPIQTTPHGGTILTQVGWAFFGMGQAVQHFFLPVSLSIEYPQAEWARGLSPWLKPSTLMCFASIMALTYVMVRKKVPPWAFLLTWAFLAYLPTSSLLVTLRSLVADRYAFPTLLPLGALFGLIIAQRVPRYATLAVLLLALFTIPLTVNRTTVFATDESLWLDALDTAPQSPRVHIGLANATEDPASIGIHLRRAVDMAARGSKQEPYALLQLGQHILRVEKNSRGAIPILEGAIGSLARHQASLNPFDQQIYLALLLAEAYRLEGRYQDAEPLIESALADARSPQGIIARGTDPVLALLLARIRNRIPLAVGLHNEQTWANVESSWAEAEDHAPGHPAVKMLRREIDLAKTER
ncbi:MAG: hypothetical protein VX916_04595 [Planctomycetota bacterium]|nr:hypothetical protein [Planctomycetota bacterium]